MVIHMCAVHKMLISLQPMGLAF